MAAEQENEDAVRFPLNQGANAKQEGADSSSPLAKALSHDNHELARLLIDNGATATTLQAMHCGHLECVRRLLRTGTDVNTRDIDTLLLPEAHPVERLACHRMDDVR
jgi:ankyrin repeat protein